VRSITAVPTVKAVFIVEQTKTPTLKNVDAVSAKNPSTSASATIKEENIGSVETKNGLNPKYVFENFIVGKGNELASAAAKAVTENPGQTYNPLFIYGGVGLGKTHLIQAVGNTILARSPKARVVYLNSEKFTNDYVQSIKNNTIEQFKKFYRTVDVLLIDDIQFMSGKEQTQEEFFHTFNTLYQNNKQIILSSDKPPKAISDIEQRLISRFEWGMIADISAPDFETRVAILQIKAAEKGFTLAEEIVQYIANVVQSNIRELEGALNRLIAHHQLNQQPLSLDLVKQVLQAITTPSKGSLTPKRVIQIVCNYFDVAIPDLVGACRRRELVIPRQIAMYLMREDLQNSYPTIGQEMGGRDHTTAIHSYNKVVEELKANERLYNDLVLIRQRLTQG
jgi:chromosomal replication initiator protein